MENIYLIRHGQDIDNSEGILNGHRDAPLTDLGLGQAETLAKYLVEQEMVFAKIFSSPLKRARKTADIIANSLKQGVENEDLLIERDFGELTGHSVAEVKSLYGADIIKTAEVTYVLKYPGIESFPQTLERGKTLLDKLKDLNISGDIALVTSGDIGKMIYAAYYQIDWEEALKNFHFGNTEIVKLSPDTNPKKAVIFSCKQHNL